MMPAWAPWDPDYHGHPYAVVQVYSDWRVNFIELLSGPEGGIRFNGICVGGDWQVCKRTSRISWRWHRSGDRSRVPIVENYSVHASFDVASRAMPSREHYRMPRLWYNEDRSRGSLLIEVQLRMPTPPQPPPPPPPPPPMQFHEASTVVIEEIFEPVEEIGSSEEPVEEIFEPVHKASTVIIRNAIPFLDELE